MGDKRVSNRDIADRLDKLIDILSENAQRTTEQVSTPTTENGEVEAGSVNVDAAYLEVMNLKAADHATAKGCEVVLYARKNRAGETKLAFATRDRYDEQITRQPSHLGAVGTFQG